LFGVAATGLMTLIVQNTQGTELPMWKPPHGAFCYDTSKDWGLCKNTSTHWPGLTGLIVNLFAIAHETTGDKKFLDWGDTIFKEAVVRNHCHSLPLNELSGDSWCKGNAMNGGDYTYGYGAKEFTQNHMSAFKWVTYRKTQPSPP
jgi:hypothetical protein